MKTYDTVLCCLQLHHNAQNNLSMPDNMERVSVICTLKILRDSQYQNKYLANNVLNKDWYLQEEEKSAI